MFGTALADVRADESWLVDEVDAPASLDLMREAAALLAGSLDPTSLSGLEAASIVKSSAEIIRLMKGLQLLATPRVAETDAWKGQGAHNAEGWLAKVNRTSRHEATAELSTAQQLASLPDTEAALRAGKLSSEQARHVAEAASLVPEREAELVQLAAMSSTGELRDRCRKIKNAATPTAAEERHAANRKRRSLRYWTDDQDLFNLRLETTPDDGARIVAALQPLTDKRFKQAYKAGEREPVHAYAADAFVDLVTTAGKAGAKSPSGSDAKVIIRADLQALQRGHVEGDEVCDLAGFGPIPVSVAQGFLGEAFIACIAENGHDVRVAHPGRRANAFQRSYLDWLGATCTTLGCNNRRLEIDHTEEFARTKHTTVDELAKPCTRCHFLRTNKGYRYGPPDPLTGKRPLLPPNPAGP